MKQTIHNMKNYLSDFESMAAFGDDAIPKALLYPDRIFYGYARVSSKDQKLDRQIDILTDFGIEENLIFTDKASGEDFNRPGYVDLLDTLREGDVVIFTSLDRLGRSYEDLRFQWDNITRRIKADAKVLNVPLLDTTQYKSRFGTFLTDLTLQIFSYQAEQERLGIRERQAQGIASAKARGITLGRPKKVLPEGFNDVFLRFV